MPLTMQRIISDAESLCARLKDHESVADRLISDAQSLHKKVDAMRQYKEEVAELNEAAHQKPRDVLIQGIQQDNRHLRELQQENKELRNALEEHQNTLEIIMSKYRKQVTQLMHINKSDRDVTAAAGRGLLAQTGQAALLDAQSNKISEMVSVIRHCCVMDDQADNAAAERIAQLTAENKGLREVLQVGYSKNLDLMTLSGSVPSAPSSTVRRRPCPEPGVAADSGFQTVRRRLPTAAAAPPKLLVAEEDDSGSEEEPASVLPAKVTNTPAPSNTAAVTPPSGAGGFQQTATTDAPVSKSADQTPPQAAPAHKPTETIAAPPSNCRSSDGELQNKGEPSPKKESSPAKVVSPKDASPSLSAVSVPSKIKSPESQPARKTEASVTKSVSPPKSGPLPKTGISSPKTVLSSPKTVSSSPKTVSSSPMTGSPSPPKPASPSSKGTGPSLKLSPETVSCKTASAESPVSVVSSSAPTSTSPARGAPVWQPSRQTAAAASTDGSSADGTVALLGDDSDSDSSEASVVSQVQRHT